MRIVLDTNVLVSALIQSRGPSALLVDAWLDATFELVTLVDQLAEFRDVLDTPRIRKRIKPAEAEELLDLIDAEAIVPQSVPADVDLSPDPDDNAIIATAIVGNAELIVTGDKGHLLSLREVEGIPIVTPREAVERLGLIPQ